MRTKPNTSRSRTFRELPVRLRPRNNENDLHATKTMSFYEEVWTRWSLSINRPSPQTNPVEDASNSIEVHQQR